MKEQLYRGGFHVFPGETKVESFDQLATEHAKKVLLDTARSLEKPTILNIAKALNMLRDRVSRLMTQLEIKDQYKEIRDAKFHMDSTSTEDKAE